MHLKTPSGAGAMSSNKGTMLIDKHVGARVRMRRHMAKLSQKALGQALGITFQQIQKYESGVNRIGSGRLQEIARALNVPISFFYQDAPTVAPKSVAYRAADHISINIVSDFLATKDGLRLCAAFVKIKNSAVRRSLVQLVQLIAEH
jgi:transcriptional regulator with XRE-family HTH domain